MVSIFIFFKKNTLIYSVFIAWYLLRDISRCIRTQKGLLRTSSVIEKRASVYQCLSPRTKKIKHATERNISNDHRRLVVRKITNMGLMGGYRERTLDTYTKISNHQLSLIELWGFNGIRIFCLYLGQTHKITARFTAIEVRNMPSSEKSHLIIPRLGQIIKPCWPTYI